MHQYHNEASGAPAVTMAALTTVGLGAVAWVVAVQLMTNVDMTTPGLGSFISFINMWMWMMAAMMLPGAAPAAFRHAHASDSVRAILLFVGSYLAVWTLVGVALYTVYPVCRPYGSFAAGAVAIAAGIYEFTPLKQQFRRRCGDQFQSGVQFGLCCVGSSIGLMLLPVAVGLMSLTWMLLIAVIGVTQKVLPGRAAVDIPVALAIIALGILIVVAPASIPGFTPPM